MMTPESITVSLEWAKKLKELGWSQDLSTGLFRLAYCECEQLHLIHNDNDTGWRIGNDYSHVIGEDGDRDHQEYIVAPTAEDLLKEMPSGVQIDKVILKISDGYESYTVCSRGYCVSDPSLANALAQVWIHLKMNNLLPSQA